MVEFMVTDTKDETGIHLFVKGELDVATAPILLESFQDAMGLGLPVNLDVSGLDFVGSVGLSLLVLMQKRARADGAKFTLSFPNNQLIKLLDTTGLREFFDFQPKRPRVRTTL